VLEAIVFGNSTHSHDEAQKRVEAMSAPERAALLSTYVGDRKNVDTVPVEPSNARITL